MQIVFDFIAGDIPFDEFWEAYCADPKIGEWLDSIADFSHEPPPVIAKDRLLYALYRTIALVYDGHVLRMLVESPYPPKDSYTTIVRRQCGIYYLMLTAILTKYPDAKRTKRYKDDDDYYFKALGRSIGGAEVMSYAAEVLDKFPRTMKKADRAAAGKEALWKAFHIKDRKFPRWAQEADWPMGKNSPMEYLGQRRDGELVELRFRDVDTGEERTVEQYY